MKTLSELKFELEEKYIPLEERDWTMAQMIKAGQRMKRSAPKMARARARAMKRFATSDVLTKRAERTAKLLKKKQLAQGRNWSDLSKSERLMISKKLKRFLPRLKKLAKRLIKVKRQQEVERKKGQS